MRCQGDGLPLGRVPVIRRAGPAPALPRTPCWHISHGEGRRADLRGQRSKGRWWFQELALVVDDIPRVLKGIVIQIKLRFCILMVGEVPRKENLR